MKEYDLIIVGGGPAGLSAGIYAMRASINSLLLDKAPLGGTPATVSFIENYPGFPNGISGRELMAKMEEQAKNFGLLVKNEEVIELELKNKNKIIKTREAKYMAKTVIIACGTQYKKLGIPGEKEFMGKGVSYCAICDGPLFKNKNIVVVGCGNSGIQEGLFLLKFVNHITFIEFLDYMTASPMLQERIKKERVDILLNYEILRINGDARVTGVTVRDRKTGETKIISAQGVFIYVGVTPNTQWLRGMVDLDSDGYIITNDKLETSISGVFAVGDVRKKSLPFFQIISAASDGAFAVFAAEKYLLS